MITLCMDTSSKYLVLGILKDNVLQDSIQEECWKKQSEEIFTRLMELTERCGIVPEDIDSVVITEGPGSYTGVRIAMTIAKVFCVMGNKRLYTIGTLQLFAGMEKCRVILDARGQRVYTAVVEHGKYIEEPSVKSIEDVMALAEELPVIGDGALIGKENVYPDLAANFAALKDVWVKAENTNLVRPEYLKSSESYLIK